MRQPQPRGPRNRPVGTRIDSLERRTLLSAAMVADVWPGADGALLDTEIVDVAGTLFFRGQSGPGDGRLWRLGGMPLKPVQVATSIRDPQLMTPHNGRLYFSARDPVHGLELFVTNADGTGSTRLTQLPNGTPDDPESFPDIVSIEVVAGKVFFCTTRYRDVYLWTTDGTPGGTLMLSSINLVGLAEANGMAVFSSGTNELCVTDGTPAGTRVIGGYAGPDGQGEIARFTGAGNRAYFVHGVEGEESWLTATDGTPSGTIRLQRGAHGELWSDFGPFAPLGDSLMYLSNEDGGPRKLWRTDGTTAGTKLVRNFGDSWVSSIELEPAGDRLFFTSIDAEHGNELWVTDGTSPGTSIVRDITLGPDATEFGAWRGWNDTFYFFVNSNYGATHTIWRSNGTETGTHPVHAISGSIESPGFFNQSADRLYFWADDGIHGTELWSTDGTSGGTRLVEDVRIGSGSGNPNFLTQSNSGLYFAADDGIHGMELWKVTDDEPFAILSGGVLTVRGTADADVITLAPRGTLLDATLNGHTLSFPAASVRRVQIESAAGNDRIDCAAVALPLTVRAGPGNDSVLGGRGSDVLIGEAGRDTLLGGRGDDTLDGQSGNDFLVGGEGNDLLSGGSGDDRMEGNAGRDTLYGRAGNDALWGGSGNDKLDGGDGNDHLMGQAGLDRSYGGAGDDKFLARDLLADVLDGGAGFDRAQIDPLLDQAGSIERLLA